MRKKWLSLWIILAGAFVAVIGFPTKLYPQANSDWTEPFPPFKIAGNLYYVGSKGLANYLITTPQGHILINSDLEENVPLIRASVERLGFKFTDIKILLISHAHWDHNAASHTIKKLTGAKYMVMDADVSVVESGGKTDFQYGSDPANLYTPTKVDGVLHDGDEVKLGGAILVAHLTPGHTKGCTTWTMKVQEDGKTFNVVIVGSPNVNPGYRLVNNTGYPQIAADYEKTFRVLNSLQCDIFLGAHGSYFDLETKYSRLKEGALTPFVDPEGYKRYVADREQAFKTELAKQRGTTALTTQSDAERYAYRVSGKVIFNKNQSPPGATVYVTGTRPINGRIPWTHAAKDGTFAIQFSDAPDNFRVCAHPGETAGRLVLARTIDEAKKMPITSCTEDFLLDVNHREKRVELKVRICDAIFAQSQSINELRRLFEYDQKAPLDVREVGVINRSGVRIHDVTYASPKSGRVTAYLVVPTKGKRHPGVVYGHWSYGTRTEFLPEAVLYAQAGVVSLLVDDLDARPAPWRRSAPGTEPEAVRENFIQSVVDLRRGIDVLLARPDVDPNRIAYVGHSSGAHWGAILSAVDKRLKTVVLMAGVPTEATILMESDDPDFVGFRQTTPKEQLDNYFRIVSPLDAINYVPHAKPTPLLFQFARFEQYFDEAAMRRYALAASEPKLVLWYDTGHGLNDVRPLMDRANWLKRYIGMQPVTPILRRSLGQLQR